MFSVILFLSTYFMFAQGVKSVEGTVTDEEGLALPGVNVIVKGSALGSVTNFDGNYTIKVGETSVLVFSYLGFETKELLVVGKQRIDVRLVEDAESLNEVVVTALGIKRQKESLGFAISQVDDKDLERSSETNIVEALAGKAAGIQVIGSGGTPGASSKIVIRGSSTISGQNQPLIVVDGVPFDNSTNTTDAGDNPFNANLSGVNNSNRALDINPDDIANVTILKGPAAAALYGARGGNGVILYTLKKKAKGLGVDLSFNTEFSKVNKLPKLQRTYAQGLDGVFSTADPGPDTLYGTDDDISSGTSSSWGPNISETEGLESYNNVDNFFKTGVTTTANASVFGGDDKRSFRASIGRTEQEGVIPSTALKRITARFNGSNKVTDNFEVSTSVSYARTTGVKAQNGSNLAGVMLGLTRAPASYDLRDSRFANGNMKTYFSIYDNPYYTAEENQYTDEVNRITGNLKLNYTYNPWLNVSLVGSVDTYTDSNRQVYAVSSLGDDTTSGLGQVNFGKTVNSEFYSDLLFSGQGDIIENLGLNYTVGFNVTSQFFESLFSRGRTLAVPGTYNLSNASELYSSNAETKSITQAIFSQVEFSFKDYMFLTLTGRNEWSSTYGTEKNNIFYPSTSLSVLPSNFIDMPKWFSYAKLRGAYSEAGIAPDPYRTETPFRQVTITDGFTNGLSFPYLGENGFGISNTLGNLGLRPEVVKAVEFGLELGFFNDRLNFSGTYYDQKTEDLLLFVPVAAESGFTSSYQNGGELKNTGLELEINADVLKAKDFNWNLAVNWSQNKSEVLELANGVEEVSIEAAFNSIGSFAIVGEPLGAFFGTKWERNDNGNLIINEETGLPAIDSETGNIGDPNPDWLMGIRNTIRYKNFTLSALLDIREGGDVWNGTLARLNNIGRSEASADRERNYVIPGVYTDGSANVTEIDANTYYTRFVGDGGGAAEQFVEDGSWIRLRDISLSYNFKPEIKFINSIDITVGARNLWLETDYKGVDPETSLTGAGSNIGGLDYFNNPGTKSYSFGVKIHL